MGYVEVCVSTAENEGWVSFLSWCWLIRDSGKGRVGRVPMTE